MKYMGSRLQKFIRQDRGTYTDLAARMLKYRKPRKNSGNVEYTMTPFLKDGHNITINSLTALMKETGMSIDFFVDFEPGELPPCRESAGVSGSNNVINSTINNDLTVKVDHLNELVHLKDIMLGDKERIIALKDAEIEQWKKRYDDLIHLTQIGGSDKNRT